MAYEEHRRAYRTLPRRLLRGEYQREKGAREFQQAFAVPGSGGIRFIGVWDTVDAVGFPSDLLAWIWNEFIYRFKFPDLTLSRRVQQAAQALAIDDERKTFHPDLWNEDRENPGRIEQVWFCGAHSNVGGGYERQGLSLVAMDWMMAQAEAAELRFIEDDRRFYREHRDPHDKLYDSRSGAGFFYRYFPRTLPALPKLHTSVLERLSQSTDGYAPYNLPPSFRLVSDTRAGKIDLEAAPSVTAWVWTRWFSHVTFLASVVVFVFVALWNEFEPLRTMVSLESLEKNLLSRWGWLAVPAASWLLAGWANREAKRLDPVWFRVRRAAFAIAGLSCAGLLAAAAGPDVLQAAWNALKALGPGGGWEWLKKNLEWPYAWYILSLAAAAFGLDKFAQWRINSKASAYWRRQELNINKVLAAKA